MVAEDPSRGGALDQDEEDQAMAKMTVPFGPHQRATRRRRRGKAALLGVLAAWMLLASSWMTRERPAPEPPGPSRSYMVYVGNLAALSKGYNDIMAQQWPAEYAERFGGKG